MSAQPENPPIDPNLVEIEIDGETMQVPKGSMIIEAADKAGMAIPRFCYHEKLPIAANCRMCLVDVEKMPKPAPACATPVMPGMKVYTRSRRALDAQRNVMEFLLINHPLDCPICDQGGECELQDLSMGYGRSVSRFVERKRVVPDEDLGSLVSSDMTRCIHCTRCIRVMDQIAGTRELGGMYRGESLQIGTYDGRPLQSELSGNVIDVCPVGALTNKVFRYRARAWELIARESIGYHDALGSNLFLHTRRGEALRAVPRDNEAINECWLSDRDRYSHEGLTAADRVSAPMLRENGNWREVDWDEALARAAEILRAQGGDDLGVLVHPATSNEEGALLKRLADGLGCGNIDHRIAQADLSDGAVAEPFAMPLAEIEKADCILLLGCNPRHEAPLLGLRVRKAVQAGATVLALNPLDFDFDFSIAIKHVAAPSKFADAALALAGKASPGNFDAASFVDALKAAERAVIIVGEGVELHPRAAELRAAAAQLADSTGASLNRLPQGANAVGLARAGVLPAKRDARGMLAEPRQAYLLYGVEPELDVADTPALLTAINGGRSVVAFAAYADASLKRLAKVILPIGLLPEIDATLDNVDGRSQTVKPATRLPGEARPGWRVLRALGAQMALDGFDFLDIDGLRDGLSPANGSAAAGRAPDLTRTGDGQFERISTTPIYRKDAVLRRSAALASQALSRAPAVMLNAAEAERLGAANGDTIRIDDGRGKATLPLLIDNAVPDGAAWIESSHPATAPLAGNGAALSLSKV